MVCYRNISAFWCISTSDAELGLLIFGRRTFDHITYSMKHTASRTTSTMAAVATLEPPIRKALLLKSYMERVMIYSRFPILANMLCFYTVHLIGCRTNMIIK
jgi:hypothetical protein